MRDFWAGLLLSFLPQRLRSHLGFYDGAPTSYRATIVSASVQMLLCLGGLGWHYFHFMSKQIGELVNRGAIGNERVQMGVGITVFLEFVLLSPLTWCLGYFMCEGGVRMFTVFVTGEVLGTGPLKLVELAYLYGHRKARERSLPPMVDDEVIAEGFDTFAVSSCREKDWDLSTTVRMGERLYEVSGIHEIDGPRPFIYLLRPFPHHRLVRRIRDFEAPEMTTREQ